MKCLFVGGSLDHKEVDVEKPLPDVYKNTDHYTSTNEYEEYHIYRLGDRRSVIYLYAVKGMTLDGLLNVLIHWYTEGNAHERKAVP